MINVAIIQPILSPNRTPVFEQLAKQEGINLKLFVLHERLPERPGWTVTGGYEFDLEIIKTVQVRLRTRESHNKYSEPYRLPIGLVKGLFRFSPHVILVSNATEALFCLIHKYLKGVRIGIIAGDTENINSKYNAKAKWFKKIIYRRLDTFCSYGDETEKYLLSIGIPENRIFKTYWAVDNDFYRNPELIGPAMKIRANFDGERCIFLTVGQLIQRKGIRQLIEAWNALPRSFLTKATLIVVGTGPEKQMLQELSQGNPCRNVIFAGHLPPNKIALYYKAADVFVFPTLEDIWGLVVNEAMAAGLPILCSHYAGCACELIKDGINGFLFDPLRPISISNTIERIMADKIIMKKMGQASTNIIKDYNFDNMVKMIKIAIFSTIV